MNSLLEAREKLQEIYAEYTQAIDKSLRLIMNLAIFFIIQSKFGYMPALSKGMVSLGVAVICTLLPPVFTVIAAAVIVLLQLYALSPGVAAVVLAVFLLVFIFYLRFAAGKAIVVLLTVLAFAVRMPVLIPVAAGVAGTMATLVPLICGTVIFYVLKSAVEFGGGLSGKESIVTVLSDFAKKSIQNKEMAVAIIAVLLGVLLIYSVKRIAIPYSWQIAIVLGAAASAAVFAVGGTGFSANAAITSMAVSIVMGLVIQFMVFNVDYARAEQVQFEDDEYYYYVKAIPKNVPGKQNERRESGRRGPRRAG